MACFLACSWFQYLEALNEMFIEVDNAQANYHYMTGMIPSYKEADSLKGEMILDGFPAASVVAYFDGIRINEADIPFLAANYPDLLLYQEGEKK